ncbi:MAG: GTP cyclohydrolase 1 type 2 [bacterium]|nr:MAG: GTP cyclohydrolase 1 type 2 [bacterium]
MKIKELSRYLENFAPLALQESYDNSGLLIGSPEKEVEKALITLDVTHEVMDEAIALGFGLIIAHHPLIFKGLKRLRGGNLVEDLVIKAVKNDVAIYAIHTNLDNVVEGVNARLALQLGLKDTKILLPAGKLKKLVVFCPESHADVIREAVLNAGAGYIGNYSHCSYATAGEGSFKALEGTHPFVGKQGEIHFEKEVRLEAIVSDNFLDVVLQAMLAVHPYEEVAYDIYALENTGVNTGAGMIGELPEAMASADFLQRVKNRLGAQTLRHGKLIGKKVKKVAVSGGSGSFLMGKAFASGADAFVTADLKYHDFFHYQNQMILIDAGHYETEQFTKDLLFELLTKKFPNFALQISKFNTNPVSFL